MQPQPQGQGQRTIPWLLVGAYVVCGALAIAGVEAHVAALTIVFKPLTTILLFGFVGRPREQQRLQRHRFQTLVEVGFLLSLVGDVALLWSGPLAFGVGLGGFLLAHVSYIVAFIGVAAGVGVGRPSPRIAIVATIFGASTVVLLMTLWPVAGALRIPVAIYASAITTMVVSAWSTPGGRLNWPWPAAVGAVLFYVSDSSLSIDTFLFHGKLPHSSLLTMGVYWLGQLGIALAARAGVRMGPGRA